MIDPRNLQTVNQATLDRAWKWLDDNLDRLQQLALHGAGSEADRQLQRKVLMLVASEVYHRRARRGDNGDTTSQADDYGELDHDP